jgi:hypothetical protein
MTWPKSSGPPLAIQADPNLPPYLRTTEPMEVEALPLQVSLLTMELATQRQMLQRMSLILETAAAMMKGPGLGIDDGG